MNSQYHNAPSYIYYQLWKSTRHKMEKYPNWSRLNGLCCETTCLHKFSLVLHALSAVRVVAIGALYWVQSVLIRSNVFYVIISKYDIPIQGGPYLLLFILHHYKFHTFLQMLYKLHSFLQILLPLHKLPSYTLLLAFSFVTFKKSGRPSKPQVLQ